MAAPSAVDLGVAVGGAHAFVAPDGEGGVGGDDALDGRRADFDAA
jgi:hypothetical protein